MPENTEETAFAHWMAPHFPGLLLDCGNETMPGIDESPRNRDWSARPTTRDQARIEDFLAPRLTPQARLLHVGIGNSRLAQRFCGKVASIAGITITTAEYEFAVSLGLPGYVPRLANKYSREFAKMNGRFDWIIDNNPSTFACCRTHFCRMLLAYKAMLAPGGMILTDTGGLSHLADDAPELARWSFSPADWQDLAGAMNLGFSQHGDHVLAMALP